MSAFTSTRFLAATALLVTVSAANATPIATKTINGTYSAVDSNPVYTTRDGAPTINSTGTFLSSPLPAEVLTLGSTTAPTNFLVVAPTSWPTNSQGQRTGNGTVTGNITVGLTLTDPSAAQRVTSVGGYAATISGGVVTVVANYAIDYANDTDCIGWSGAACALPSPGAPDSNTVLGDTLAVTFTDGAVLDIFLYNWTDWNMAPQISFDLVSVPEPMSMALLGVGIIGIVAARRLRTLQVSV